MIPFVILHGDILIKKEQDRRSCLEWIHTMGYTTKQWEHAPQGYLQEGFIQFYAGRNRAPLPYISDLWVSTLYDIHIQIYGGPPYFVMNGETVYFLSKEAILMDLDDMIFDTDTIVVSNR